MAEVFARVQEFNSTQEEWQLVYGKAGLGRGQKLAYYLLVVPLWAVVCLASVHQSHHHAAHAHCYSLMSCKLPLFRKKPGSTDAASSCTHSLLAQSPLFLLCSFSSTWNSAVNFFLILCRLNWTEWNFMNEDPELKKSWLQQCTRGSVTEAVTLICPQVALQEVQHDQIFC